MSSIEKILADIQALSPQDRDQLFDRLADFEALRLRRAVQVQKERLSSQADTDAEEGAQRQAEPGIH